MHDDYDAFGRDLLQKRQDNSAPPEEHEYDGRNIFDFLSNDMIKIKIKKIVLGSKKYILKEGKNFL